MFDYELFVIGGGSGGVRAARMAALTGAKVGLAEQSRMGGTCVIRGCVPKKLMVNAADFSDAFVDAAGFGWSVGETAFNWKKFREAKDREISRLEGIYRSILRNSGVRIYDARAELADAHTVRLAGGRLRSAKHILIATGGVPYLPPTPGVEHAVCSDDIFLLDDLPERILVVGGGYIACEFSSILNGLGCDVTQHYRGELILRGFDDDIRNHVFRAMAARGIDIRQETDPRGIKKSASALSVADSQGGSGTFDMVFFATGRRPATAGLGLEKAGVALGKAGEILVDGYSQSSVPSVFAVGDVTGRISLTPVAIREGAAFAETVFKANPTKVEYENVPTAVFTRPEIGAAGMTQAAAEQTARIEIYKTAFRPLSGVIAGRDEKILMKIIVERGSRKVLGVHIAGPGAAELIQLAGIALKMGTTKDDFDRTVPVHPTVAEELVTMKDPVPAA